MKTSLTVIPCVVGSALLYIRVRPGLSFAIKRIGPPCCTFVTLVTCYPLRIILLPNYLLPIISVPTEGIGEVTMKELKILQTGICAIFIRPILFSEEIIVQMVSSVDARP